MQISDTQSIPDELDKAGFGYPKPQCVRDRWLSLDGPWSSSFDLHMMPDNVSWEADILVPFPPEAELSGIASTGYHSVIWYQRRFTLPEDWQGDRVLLHFGAVDYGAQVWVNDRLVVRHEGGHTPFSADITDVLQEGEQIVTVRAEDDPLELDKPRGKQDWEHQPHGIWYPRTTGIWQSVWLEPINNTHIKKLRFTPNLTSFSVKTSVQVEGGGEGLSLDVHMMLQDRVLVADTWQLEGNNVTRQVYLPDPGIEDARRHYLWSPEHPTLIQATFVLKRGETVLDEVRSYTALRSVAAEDGRFFLNGRPYFLRLALDQGYWDEGLLAAPNVEALRKDVELAKAMGFNGVRKHQKIEDPRYLRLADELGLLVWEEMPSAYAFTPEAVNRLAREWLEVIERDYNHPCIVAWVCFNESWGVPDLPLSAEQRHAVHALYHLTKALDATRPVVGNDGWEHVVTDLLTIHDYSRSAETLSARYGTAEACRLTSQQRLEHGRVTVLPDTAIVSQPIILSEFGGIRFHPEGEGWGYQQVDSPEALLEQYRALVAALPQEGLAGFCYTQFADTFQEQNGLLFSDRRPKLDLEALARATRGGR